MTEERHHTRSCPEGCVFLCRANGEGAHDFHVAKCEADVMAFYKTMWGEDEGGGIQSQIDHFRDDDNWSNSGTAYECKLYCSTFEVWVVDAAHLASRSETAPRCPDNMPDVIDTLVDAERYRWFRDECSQERQIVIIEMSEGRPELLEHHIDKGRCGL